MTKMDAAIKALAAIARKHKVAIITARQPQPVVRFQEEIPEIKVIHIDYLSNIKKD